MPKGGEPTQRLLRNQVEGVSTWLQFSLLSISLPSLLGSVLPAC